MKTVSTFLVILACCGVAVAQGVVVCDSAAAVETMASPGVKALAATNEAVAVRRGAIALTDRLGVRAEPGASRVQLVGTSTGKVRLRGELAFALGGGDASIRSIEVAELSKRSAAIRLSIVRGRAVAAVVLRLGRGQPYVRVEPGEGVGVALLVQSTFAVMPDFFADDLVLDAATLPATRLDVVADRTLVFPTDAGACLMMPVWRAADIDVVLHCTQVDNRHAFTRLNVPAAKDNIVWIALSEAEGIWHRIDVDKADAGKARALDWTWPFPAQWRIDWRRDDALTGSWEMIRKRGDGRYTKTGWGAQTLTISSSRKRWTTVLGTFRYPAWIDRKGRGHVQPLSEVVRFTGPALVYPVKRTDDTPAAHYAVADLLRETLGVGPCRYILDVEGQSVAYRGMATCEAADKLNAIYKAGSGPRRRKEVDKILAQVLAFMQHIRGRIGGYVEFAEDLRTWLTAQKARHPKSAESINRLIELTRIVDEHVAERADKIGKPEDASAVIETFRKDLLGRTGEAATTRCKQLTSRIVEIGGNQDELAGRLRMDVKTIRQQAMLTAAREPGLSEIAREIRKRSREVLQKPAHHEGAFH